MVSAKFQNQSGTLSTWQLVPHIAWEVSKTKRNWLIQVEMAPLGLIFCKNEAIDPNITFICLPTLF